MGYQRMTSGGSVSPTLQSKTASPSTSQQIIIPDSGYDGLSDVTIDAMNLQNKTVTPTSSQQIITADSGYDGLDEVTVEAGGTVVHTDTYTPAVNTSANDMGASHKYRYVNTSGMIKPSGTTSASYTTNGTSTVNVKNYENINITRNISASLSSTTLWSNSSPTSNFPNTTITLSQSMDNFTYIEIYYKNHQNGSLYNSAIWRVSDIKNFKNATNSVFGVIGGRQSGSNSNFVRVITYVSNSQLTISAASAIGGTTTGAGSPCTPLYIYGLK